MKAEILKEISNATPAINRYVESHINKNLDKTYSIIIVVKTGKVLLTELKNLPEDEIEHSHKSNVHFYFVVLDQDRNYCTEGYLYLLNPNFHLSLLRVLNETEIQERWSRLLQ